MHNQPQPEDQVAQSHKESAIVDSVGWEGQPVLSSPVPAFAFPPQVHWMSTQAICPLSCLTWVLSVGMRAQKLLADQCTGLGLRAKQGPALPAFHKCSVSRALEVLEGREAPLNPCPTLTALLGKGGGCRANHLFIRDCITKLALELVTESG